MSKKEQLQKKLETAIEEEEALYRACTEGGELCLWGLFELACRRSFFIQKALDKA